MMCKSPYMVGALMPVPCTRCMPCRYNRRRMWTFRMELESMKHAQNSFLTLTYDDKHLPSGGTLVPRDAQLFLKRLRKLVAPLKIRFYLVGEYGDQTWRPHYHAALFGIGPDAIKIVQQAWNKGHVMLGDLNRHSAQYIAGYVTKKMTQKDDPRLKGLYPEFARMSNRPGIGATAAEDIARAMVTPDGEILGMVNGDVPMSLKVGTKSMPLARYIRRKIREYSKMETGTPGQALSAFQSEMRAMLQNALNDDKNTTLKEVIVKTNAQKVLNFETRTKIYKQRKTL